MKRFIFIFFLRVVRFIVLIASVKRVEPLFWKNSRQLLSISVTVHFFRVSIQRRQPSLTIVRHSLLIFFLIIFEFTVLKIPLLYNFSLLPDLPLPVLRTLAPLSPVKRVVLPVHLPVSVSQILDKRSFVVTAARPLVHSFAVSLIVDIRSFILLRSVLPNSIPEPQPIFELSLINRPVVPDIGALPFRFSIGVHPFVPISVMKQLNALPMFVPVFDIPVILGQTRPNITLSLRFVELPRPRIELIARLPLSYSMFHTVDKTAVVYISVIPQKHSILIFRFIIDKFTNIHIAKDVLHSVPVFTVVLEIAFVKPEGRVGVEKQTETVVQVVAGVAEVEGSCGF